MKYLFKNAIKKIFKNIGRYLSIILIIALGVSVFLGLYESTTGMLYTTDKYYDDNNLMDYKIISSYGLTSGDVEALKKLNEIETVIPSYSFDVLYKGEPIRVHAIEDKINNVVITKGKLPQNQNECVGDFDYFKIGEIVSFDNSNIKINKCKITALVTSPLYIREDKGISSVGSGKLTSFIFIDKDNFDLDYFTEVYLIAKDTKELSSYYDDYTDKLIKSKEELEELKPIRETIRYEELLKEGSEKIKDAETELNDKITKGYKELKSTKKTLDNAAQKISEEESSAFKKINEEENKLNYSYTQIKSSLKSYNIEEDNLNETLNDIEEEIKTLTNQLNKDDPSYEELKITIAELDIYYKNLYKIQTSINEIKMGFNKLEEEKINIEAKFNLEKAKVYDGIIKYEEGFKKLESEEKDALDKIEKEHNNLKTLEKPKWYLLDRTDSSGYIGYKDDVVKVDAIAKLLPIFFILVVTLMVSNTLTRLVEEERTEMGILLANGYSKTRIIFSYLFYVLSAGLFGLTIGLTIGYTLIPKVIYSVFLARYYIPRLISVVSPLPFSLVIIITLTMMSIVTIFASLKELKYSPASLLRPKSPKLGKKIFLEKINFLWSRLNFLTQTTARNLFRYKKRIIMTVVGVSGSMALLIAGLGINDSINTISKLQYGGVIKYDAMYVLKEEETTLNTTLNKFFINNEIVNPLLIKQSPFKFYFKDKIEDVYLTVPENAENFNNYVSLNSSITNKKITIPKKGAIVTKQFADLLNLKKGDLFSIRNNDNELFYMHVEDIVINYVSHYIYISEDYYKTIFNEDLKYNMVIADGEINKKVDLNKNNILAASYTKDIAKTFNSFVSGLNKIIIMIVIFAGFLAFVVLYNLTIINISERKREIATFKVLGFYNKEISIYVFRETLFLTTLGIIGGLFLGTALHRFIIGTAETDTIMFLRQIKPISFILSAITTLLFTAIVQLIINKVLKDIPMIDSLKITE